MMPSYQLKLPLEISKIIEIPDPVYTFNKVFHHIELKIPFFRYKIPTQTNCKLALPVPTGHDMQGRVV